MDVSQIVPEMPVVCSQGREFATGRPCGRRTLHSIKQGFKSQTSLYSNELGDDHCEGQVVVDRPGEHAMLEWSETPTDSIVCRVPLGQVVMQVRLSWNAGVVP